jgi:hypothetical protein
MEKLGIACTPCDGSNKNHGASASNTRSDRRISEEFGIIVVHLVAPTHD